ncbi:MAG: EAL domain-containing protein [Rhodocyclaceae bacterium]|nr:EAL domain-containing protein [Rhodocyclaceae bacterium]
MLFPAETKPLLLLVDDQPANLQLLVAALKDHYRLKTATNGHDALAIATKEPQPELIVLDVHMPEMNGLQVLARLRENALTRKIPVILVTADVAEQTQLDGLEHGADDYLTKPISPAVLRARIRHLLDKRHSERQLQLAAHVFEHSGEAIVITDRHNQIIDVNPAFTRLTGYTLDEVRGKNPKILSSGHNPPETYADLWRSLKEKGFWQGELWDRHKSGAIYPKLLTISTVKNERGEIEYFIGSFTDITERKANEERIRHLAHHDPLTSLPNRLFFSIALEQAIAEAHREKRQMALLFLDMDRFKLINDTLGHQIGDLFLIEVAYRIKASVRESDVVARLGGDEFVVLLTRIAAQEDAARVAQKILAALNAPFELDAQRLHSSPSIGIALFPSDGDTSSSLLKNADSAMYHAKERGRNQIQFFSPAMNAAAAARLELEHALREAWENKAFVLFYQPQLCARTRIIDCAEVLLRWFHPQRGAIAPSRFVPLAEDLGLINALGSWVIEEACRQLARWKEQGLAIERLAINLSAHQLRDPNFVETVHSTLQRFGIAPQQIELEITETVAMAEPERAIGQLQTLRALGVSLAIDDFGTGYSSLAYLKHLPIQAIKLDRSFVKDIESDANDAAISAASIALAHQLGLSVTAEGVETEAQEKFLVGQHDCDRLQGYRYGKPMPAEEFAQRYLCPH